jgi:hypothetical protein
VLRRRPGKIFGALIEEVRFAADSLLEEGGFEPAVPRIDDDQDLWRRSNIIELQMPAPNFSTWVNQHHTGELDSSHRVQPRQRQPTPALS